MEIILVNVLGWTGAILGIVAYYMVSNNKVAATSFNYQIANIVSAILVFTNSAYYGAFPSAMVNVIWVIIGLMAMHRFGLLTKRSRKVG